MASTNVQDRINQAAWRSRAGRRFYAIASGWTDPGEAAAFGWLQPEMNHRPILDVGVGGGRTAPLLLAISDDYTAIDYTAEQVASFRREHPGRRVHQMDARDMSAFADASFSLVVFSYNGIDSVDLAGRRAILGEIARVMAPGGLVLFSTHNLAGPSYRENPRHLLRKPAWAGDPVRTGIDTVRILYSLPIGTFNFLRHSHLNRQFDGCAIRVCAAHKFGVVVMYTDLAAQQRQLTEVGLSTEAVFGNATGRRIQAGDDVSADAWFHFIARKRPGSGP